ncbi:MAG TPA: DNA-3-methyladenine glycosylase [Bacteroidetes bacterium]|nr:DNA-3-methyladenine glycosylase [Bacteroidota bacterium]
MKILPKEFYLKHDVVDIARMLLGKIIVSNVDGIVTSGMIVETEAYKAPDDKASHAYNNLRTARTETMFREGGIAYIYLVYGIHHLFNVVTGQENLAHAVLIRAIDPIEGINIMLNRRNMSKNTTNLTNGPGKLTQALGITKGLNGIKLYDHLSPVFIIDEGININTKNIFSGPRIGIDYAEEWVKTPWRFWIEV